MPYTCGWTPVMRVVDNDGHLTDAKIMQFVVGKAVMGSVYWSFEGHYYPTTQLQRYGRLTSLQDAKNIVEHYGLLQVMQYPTYGNA